jgi:hypothetical protein
MDSPYRRPLMAVAGDDGEKVDAGLDVYVAMYKCARTAINQISQAVEQVVAPHVASARDRSEPLSKALRGLKPESDARIFVKELTTGGDGETAALRTEVDSLRRELRQAQDHAAQRTRDMDNMFKYEARNTENTRDIATALKSMGSGLRRLLAALPGNDPNLQRGVREMTSHVDNLEETMETVSGCSQSLTLEKKPPQRTATSTITTPATPSTSTASVAAPLSTQPKTSGVADAISSAMKVVSSTMEAALKKKKSVPTATVTREESPVHTGSSSPRISSANTNV